LPKERLDILLVKSGCFDSREQARRAIMAGLVCVNGELEDKPRNN
jgi:23S rRNA (cytidine1920-2'-O)/16S rRNA (cytidine1409-2'-O)-methyltransferase